MYVCVCAIVRVCGESRWVWVSTVKCDTPSHLQSHLAYTVWYHPPPDDDVGANYGEDFVPSTSPMLNTLDLSNRGISHFMPGAFDCYTFENTTHRPTAYSTRFTQVRARLWRGCGWGARSYSQPACKRCPLALFAALLTVTLSDFLRMQGIVLDDNILTQVRT